MIDFKDKLMNLENTVGSWQTIGHTAITEIMCRSGIDFLVIDIEHTSISIAQAFQLIQVTELSDVVPIVRVNENNSNIIGRVMDLGAHGVIVPMVNTKEDAERAVCSAKYPPKGNRGVGISRAQKFGYGFEEYKKWAEEKSIVIVQIEHIKAVENIEAILKTDSVDGFIIGPYDLSASIGLPGKFDHPKVIEVFDEVINAAKRLKISAGFHVVFPDVNKALQKIRENYNLIVYSVDFYFLGEMCKNGVNEIKGFVNNR